MKLRELECFCKAVDTGSFSAAAEQLNLAQPALGWQIRQLEEKLESKLFTRHSRGVTPTSAGQFLYDNAKRILEEIDRIGNETRRLSSEKRTQIRLGVCQSMAKLLHPQLLIDAGDVLPDLKVTVFEERTSVLLENLHKGNLDLAFLNNMAGHIDLESTAVLEENLLFITTAGQEHVGETITLAEALTHDLAMGSHPSIIRQIVEMEAQRLFLPMSVAYELRSHGFIKTMVASGTASSIMTYGVIADELQEGKLVGRQIVSPTLNRTLYVVRPRVNDIFFEEPGINLYVDNIINAYIKKANPWAFKLI